MVVAADFSHQREKRSGLNKHREPIANYRERRCHAETRECQHRDGHRNPGDEAGKQSGQERLGSGELVGRTQLTGLIRHRLTRMKHRSEEFVYRNLCQSVCICGFFSAAIRTSVAMMRAPATKVPRNVPDTFEAPPARRRWFTAISRMRRPAR